MNRLIVAVTIGMVAAPSSAIAVERSLEGEWELAGAGAVDLEHVIHLRLFEGSGDQREKKVDANFCDVAALKSASRWRIVSVADGDPQTPITPDSVNVSPGAIIIASTGWSPSPESKYQVVLATGTVEVGCDRQNAGTRSSLGSGPFAVDNEDLRTDVRYVRRRPEQRFQLGGGDNGGTVSTRIEYLFEKLQFGNEGQFLFTGELDGNADVTLQPGERDEYFNRMDARLSFGVAMIPELLGRRYIDLRLAGGIESDQTADNADWVVEAGTVVYAKNPVTDYLARKISPHETARTPRIAVNYQFAIESASDTALKPETDGGAHRIEVLADWQVSVLDQLNLTAIPALGATYSVNLIAEGGGRYDFEEKEFYDLLRVGAEFHPIGQDGDLDASLMVWWERGQAAPVFERFDAILAGIKAGF